VGSVVIVEVDEPGVAVVAFDFCVPVLDVCPFLEEDPVESFDLAVGLGSVGTGFLHGSASGVTCLMPQA